MCLVRYILCCIPNRKSLYYIKSLWTSYALSSVIVTRIDTFVVKSCVIVGVCYVIKIHLYDQ